LFHYGFSVAFWDILESQKKRIIFFSEKINENKHASILRWLTNRFYYQILDFRNRLTDTNSSIGYIPRQIWICWWDGIDKMPLIVKACYNSVLKYSNGFNVILITKFNFKDFIIIPDNILKKMNMGKITVTHFSDILRMSLLSEYGGLWLDATVLVTGNIELRECAFFTIKRELGGDDVPKRRWTGNCIGGTRNNPLFLFVREFLLEYWKYCDELIDYFLIDYSIMIGYSSIPQIREIIDKTPLCSQEYYILQDNLMTKFSSEYYTNFTKNTIFHKLTWKEKIPIMTVDNEFTMYGYILELFGNLKVPNNFH
jgi:hypothetical protein